MPRLDHRLTLEACLSVNERALLVVLERLVNPLRRHAGLPLLQEDDLCALVRLALCDVTRAAAPPKETP
jgi:hypothetical protein